MKKYSILNVLVIGLLFSQLNFASTNVQVERGNKNERQYVKTKDLLKNISVYGFYNMSDKANMEGSVGGANFTGELTTTNSFGLGAEGRLKQMDNGLAVRGGVSYEFGRTFNKRSGKVADRKFNIPYESPKPELSAWILSLSGEMPISQELSLFGGGNFNFPSLKNQTGTYSGKIGWQAGASYTIAENFVVDGMWRSLNFNGSDDNLSFDNVNIAGFLIRGRIAFE